VSHAVTLTGVGDRAHVFSTGSRLAVHIQDVINLIGCEELDNVVLVGHSYAGMVITGVADTLLQHERPVLQQIVYLDAIVPHPGESWSSQQPPDAVAARIQSAMTDGGGVAILPPDPKVFGLEAGDYEWVKRRMTPQPFGLYQEKLHFDAVRVATLPRTFIDCTDPALAAIAAMRKRVREEAGWRVLELKAGHDSMISAPRQLAELLLSCAGSRHS